ncbi:HutD/Ves family protein [Streptomyces sp. NBC_00344]|uniref:HutD/Ves family protein n=1 Tax=Streptomyces sp. NBC_00344 TaxID=2975720 RepID=UPI002E1F265A
MTVRILPAAGRTASLWKNGGGTTREVAAGPEGAAMDDFAWRVSLAEVGRDGPFSAFPGVTRTLTVVEGAGMDLDVDGARRTVGERFVPQDFAGDATTYGWLLAGPVVNLNVMYRRGLVDALVSVVRGRLTFGAPPGTTVLVVALDGTAALEGTGTELGPYDAALVTEAEPGVLRADGRTALVVFRPGCPGC